jgi:hypothetical protein
VNNQNGRQSVGYAGKDNDIEDDDDNDDNDNDDNDNDDNDDDNDNDDCDKANNQNTCVKKAGEIIPIINKEQDIWF